MPTYEENRLHNELIKCKISALNKEHGISTGVIEALVALIDAKIDFAKAKLRDDGRDGGGMP